MKLFDQFINESRTDSFAETIASEILEIVSKNRSAVRFERALEYADPVPVSITLEVIRNSNFKNSTPNEFSDMPWEVINFKRLGFAVDANTSIVRGSSAPEISVTIFINPEQEKDLLAQLYYRVLDTIRHELEHSAPTHANSDSGQSRRDSAQYSYEYFILPDEIPAMVAGLTLSAKKRGLSLVKAFHNYLRPFLEYGFINSQELDKVIQVWLEYSDSH